MRTYGVVRGLSVTAAPVQVLGPSQQRVAIFFSPPLANTYTVSTDPSVASGAGLNLLTTTPGILITRELYGDAVTKAWFAVGGASGATAGLLETISEG
jgi:hypothetical protein